MRRERLRRIIALCIYDVLQGHKFTFANVKRYVTSETLTLYRIRPQTKITARDLEVGLQIAYGAVKGKPIFYRYAKQGSPYAEERKQIILTAPLADLIKS